MSDITENPFESVESAQEFIALLEDAVKEARRDVETEIAAAPEDRRRQALQLIDYHLTKLSVHTAKSRRILNDLRSLRRLLFQEREIDRELAE